MYSYITGKLVEVQDGYVVVENNGIGYEIAVSNNTIAILPKVGLDCKLFCELTVNANEGELSLLGFGTKAEKEMFVLLTSISGVGPKTALGMLSGIKAEALTTAILTNDIRTISSLKGIGKKTAERICLELREKVGNLSKIPTSATASTMDDIVINALNALESMGLPRQQAYESVMKAREKTSDISEIIRTVLRGLNNK